MATLVRMPSALAGVTEAAIQSWLVAPGDAVAVGQPIAEIETEKATIEYAAEAAGTFGRVLVEAGASVEVGTPIAVILDEGEGPEAADALVAGEAPGAAAAVGTARIPSGATPTAMPAPAAPAVPDDAERRVFASPLVRRIARERGIDLAGVRGTGPGGRIVRRDLDALVSPPAPAPVAVTAPVAADVPGTEVPLTPMRRAIARRLTESTTTVPHFFVTAHCRVDRLLALRREINEAASRKVSVNDFVLKAVSGAMIEVPEANAIWNGDHIRRFDTVDVGVAVAIEGGLLTPVVRGVERLTLTGIAAAVADLAERARTGRIKQHELEGGSFAVSNLGMYGVDEFSAIINPPHSGILAVAAATPRPVVADDGERLEVGQVMTVTLSADHRVLDGAVAAQWLAAFRRRIEQPLGMLA